MSAYRDDVGAPTFLPSHETSLRCQDKAASVEAIIAAGLPVPESRAIVSAADVEDAASAILGSHERAWVRYWVVKLVRDGEWSSRKPGR